MIKLPEGYVIHERDSTRLLGGVWSVRVMYCKAASTVRNGVLLHEAFVMSKNIKPERIGPVYAARMYGFKEWIEFDNEQDMCIAMCAKHRMLIR